MGAFAADTHDSTYDFTFAPQSTAPAYTELRYKTNSTSAYMKLNSISSGGRYSATVVDLYGNNFSRVWTYTFDSSNIGQGRYLSNYAYEDRGYNVGVKIKATRYNLSPNIGVNATGVWSPDSI